MNIVPKYKSVKLTDIAIGDVVRCWDFKTQKIAHKPIHATFTPTILKENQVTITLANDLKLTGSHTHPVWCKSLDGQESWQNMGELQVGYSLFDSTGRWIEINLIEYIGEQDKTFYDFTVGDYHNYFAGKSDQFILSHNSATVNVPFWHYEIEDIIVLKNNNGTENSRVRNLDYVIQFSKLLYDRLQKNENITLFSPNDVPELYEAFGTPAFDALYEKCEKDSKIKHKRTMRATSFMSLFVKERTETGRIYVMNIDHCNEHGAFLERVTMTNLCTEITFPTKPIRHIDDPGGEIGICVLSAINLLEVKNDNDLANTCDLIVRQLDELIDYQTWSIPAAKNFITNRRALGIGVTNLAAWLAKQHVKYTDSKAPDIVDEMMEKIQYNLLSASCKLAEEKGPCSAFDKTKYSKGILPIDTYKKNVDKIVTRKPTLDWEGLRQRILTHGLRNSTLTAQMPVESSSITQNTTNGIEPVRSLYTIKGSKKSQLPVLVPNYHLRNNYTLAFEMRDNRGFMNIVAAMQKWMDQAISMNLYYDYEHYPNKLLPDTVVIRDILYAYSVGIKTIYYSVTNDNDKQSAGCAGGACTL